jgi:hypothetical protein
MQSEETAREFLLYYAGGGTLFPFDVLKTLAATREDIVRVVISDSDFISNIGQVGSWPIFETAIQNSTVLVCLFAVHGGDSLFRQALAPALKHPNFKLVGVSDLNAFGRMAADLSDALFGR